MHPLIRWYALIFVLFIGDYALGQTRKRPCLYESLTRSDTRASVLSRYQRLYNLQSKEKVASVGAGGGNKEILYSMLADSLLFYVQDIDSTCLSKPVLRATIQQLYSAANQRCNDTFRSVLGTETDTKLPERFFDKVLMENTLHELSKPTDILRSIRKSLKPDGLLFIEDFIAQKPGQKHRGCGKLLFTDAAMIGLLNDSGFRFVEYSYVFLNNTVDKMYKFALSD